MTSSRSPVRICVFRTKVQPPSVALDSSREHRKAQGQTLERVGVFLAAQCFAHGQLYVAASRVGHPDRLRFAVLPDEETGKFLMRNIVYREALTGGGGSARARPQRPRGHARRRVRLQPGGRLGHGDVGRREQQRQQRGLAGRRGGGGSGGARKGGVRSVFVDSVNLSVHRVCVGANAMNF